MRVLQTDPSLLPDPLLRKDIINFIIDIFAVEKRIVTFGSLMNEPKFLNDSFRNGIECCDGRRDAMEAEFVEPA